MHLEKKLCIKKRSLVRGGGTLMREVVRMLFSHAVFSGVLSLLDNALSSGAADSDASSCLQISTRWLFFFINSFYKLYLRKIVEIVRY